MKKILVILSILLNLFVFTQQSFSSPLVKDYSALIDENSTYKTFKRVINVPGIWGYQGYTIDIPDYAEYLQGNSFVVVYSIDLTRIEDDGDFSVTDLTTNTRILYKSDDKNYSGTISFQRGHRYSIFADGGCTSYSEDDDGSAFGSFTFLYTISKDYFNLPDIPSINQSTHTYNDEYSHESAATRMRSE